MIPKKRILEENVTNHNWDLYFLRIAAEVSKNTKCMSRQIGAVLVKDKSVVSTGYNGPARSVKHCNERNFEFYNNLESPLNPCNVMCGDDIKEYPTTCPRKYYEYKSGEGLHLCQAGHAERNALIQAARNGIATLDTTLYCYCGLPCTPCMIEIINAGVARLVYLDGPIYDNYSSTLLEESNMSYTKINIEEI